MNILLTAAGIIGKDEFVTTDAPNNYVTVLRITPEQAEHFSGHERIGIRTIITEEDASTVEVYGVGDDNRADGWIFTRDVPNAFTNEGAIAVLQSLEDREFEVIKAFLDAVPHEDLEGMYEQLVVEQLISRIMGSAEAAE